MYLQGMGTENSYSTILLMSLTLFLSFFPYAIQKYELTKVDSFFQNELNTFHEYLHYDSVYHKLAVAKSIANDWTTRVFAICLHGD